MVCISFLGNDKRFIVYNAWIAQVVYYIGAVITTEQVPAGPVSKHTMYCTLKALTQEYYDRIWFLSTEINRNSWYSKCRGRK